MKHITILFIILLGSSHLAIAKKALYLDASQPIEKRVDDLLERMTLEEKVAQMCQFVGLEHMRHAEKDMTLEEMQKSDARGFYKDLHSSQVAEMIEQGKIGSFLHVLDVDEANEIQKLAQKSRLKIPVLIGIDAIHGTAMVNGATVYPSPITLSSSWDPELLKSVGVQTAAEMRATGSHWTFTPNVDVARDARWGRVGETFGEDAYLVTELGLATINGLQSEEIGNSDVLACVKHMAAGSEPVNGLNFSPMDVSERTLREVFLPPFKKAIEENCYTVMMAHNEINGTPCHASKWLMTDILRNEWGFEGFIVSDWTDIERLATNHRVAKDQKEACYLTVDAGMDMHMHDPNFLEPVVELVKEGKLSEARIDESARRILTAKFQLGLFENPFVDTRETKNIVFNKAHQQLALDAARQSIILLKNDELLPLDPGRYKKILVTGPNADNHTILGDWVMPQPAEQVTTIAEGLQQVAPNGVDIEYFDSGKDIFNIEEAKIREAAEHAKDADVTVVVVGSYSLRYNWNNRTCGENVARTKIDFAGKQLELVQALHAAGKPVIVVLVNGRPLSEPWVAENIPAIIESWEPGSLGGQAVAEIIFGQVNPSGKLTVSFPRSVGQIQTIYNHKPSHYFRTYVLEETGPLYEFGYGLSYSTFQYSEPALADNSISTDGSTSVRVDVTNTSEIGGDEIVQLYIRDNVSQVTRPVKELKGFKRISLQPGETQTVTQPIDSETLAYYNLDMQWVVEPGEFTIMVGSSSRDEDLQKVTLLVE